MKKLDKERFLKIIGELQGNVLIVEGLKDEKTLKSLGLKNIVRISGKALIRVAQKIEKSWNHKATNHDVIILTDFDSKGKKLAARLTCLLQRYKIHPNMRLRGEVMKLGFNKIEDMYGVGFVQPAGYNAGQVSIGGDDHVKISTNINKIHDKGTHKSERRSRKTRYNRSSIRSD
jgi:5S rRNA maturation endonuclease (ribonuclease M5)